MNINYDDFIKKMTDIKKNIKPISAMDIVKQYRVFQHPDESEDEFKARVIKLRGVENENTH